MIGVTRGISTLAGAAVAGILLWFATQMGAETSGEYWATYGLIAAGGLTMALSQILGGWTKWGWPRFSTGVFALALLPALVAGAWILLARQPADWMNTSNWSRDLGMDGIVADLGNILPAIAFGLGLIFGLCFDTAGPRRAVVEDTLIHEEHRRDTDAPLMADRHTEADTDVHNRDADLRDRDDDVRADRPVVTTPERKED